VSAGDDSPDRGAQHTTARARTGCRRALPADLQVKRLVVRNCPTLQALPAGLRCHELDARGTPLRRLPEDLAVAWIAGFDDPDAYRPVAET
jgi:hypothetical protein